MRLSATVPLILLATASCAKVTVVPVTAATRPVEGVFYALPNTVVRVLLKADQKTATGAPYATWAPIFAPGSTPVCEKGCTPDPKNDGVATKTAYSIQDGATFTTLGEPDASQVYLVKFRTGRALDQAINLTWNEAGLLSTASSTVTNRASDIALSGLKLVGTLGSKLAFGGPPAAPGAAAAPPCKDIYGRDGNDVWIVPLLKAAGDPHGATLVANYCEIPAAKRHLFPSTKAAQDSLELARDAYVAHVAPLVKARLDALTTRNLLDPLPFITRLETLIDQQLAALFIGTTATKTWEAAFDLRPKPSDSKADTALYVLSVIPAAGLCIDRGLLAAESKAVPSAFLASAGACASDATKKDVLLTLRKRAESSDYVDRAGKALRAHDGEAGFRYRIPVQVQATLADAGAARGDGYGSSTFAVAQFGKVGTLPGNLKSKVLTSELAMIEATGGLKSFKLGTTGGLDAATIDALTGVGGTVLDARATKLKQDADNAKQAAADAKTATDELTVLTRQQTLLKLKDEICELQKKYGLACTVQP